MLGRKQDHGQNLHSVVEVAEGTLVEVGAEGVVVEADEAVVAVGLVVQMVAGEAEVVVGAGVEDVDGLDEIAGAPGDL